VSSPEGGFVVWVRMPERVDSIALYGQALKAGIMIAPGPMFSPRGRFRNFVRLNAGAWTPDLDRTIATLGRLARG
jgi:DNA-binding transcriptional MocR family regulator